MEKIAITQSMLDEAWEKKRRYNILLTYQHFCPMLESRCMFVMTI